MPSGVAGHGSQRIALIGSFGHELLRQLEVLRRDDLQIRECFRLRTAAPKHAGVHDIMQNVTNGSFVPVLSVTGLDAHLRQEVGDFESAVAGANTQVEHHTHDLCLIGIDLQLENLMLALVVCAAGYQVIAVRGGTTTEAAFLHHLPEGGLGTHGGFLTLTVCLPEADVVGEAVNMRINPLFTFVDAPNLNAVVDEPLDYERRFFSSSANTVEHEHQQDIEFALFSIFLDELDLVTVTGADFESRHTVFLFLVHDGPAHPLCKLTASFSLHGDIGLILVIVVDLLGGGDAVQAAHSVLDAEYILIRTTNSFSHNVSFLSMNDLEM